MSKSERITIPIEVHRQDASASEWDLPPWGHSLSQGVMPLFIAFQDRLIPIGTTFTIGRGVPFVVTAAHNIRETWKYEARLNHLLFADVIPLAAELQHVGLYVLYQRPMEGGRIECSLWPLETVDAGPPSDVVFAFPQFQKEFPTLVFPVSFDLPPIGEKVWSVGYADFVVPDRGIPLDQVRNGTFDWRRDYSHRFIVVEGTVERIFYTEIRGGISGWRVLHVQCRSPSWAERRPGPFA